ncbi:MAG TPA: MFS transporter [Steroidobacteraceae bacterium]|nr:MFS transporter [Steroidobacteraceae bacterium]
MREAGRDTGKRIPLAALAILTGINLLNYLDRYVVSAVLPDLKQAPLRLTDSELGSLMSGFLIVYTLTAPVFGRLGDRGSRPKPLAIGVFLWSLATGLGGLARNYLQLLGARAAVGIGEAAYATIAPSMLADFFERRTRGRAFAIFNMAIPVGAALGYIVGGFIRHHFGWRAAFYVAGVPGVLLAVWILRIPDPPRGIKEEKGAPSSGDRVQPGSWQVYLLLLRGRAYVLTVLGYAAYTFAVGGLAYWMPTFLERVRGIPDEQASAGFGAIVVVTGFAGTFAGGWLGDYWLRYSREAYLWMSGWATLLAVPAVWLALSAPERSVFYPALIAAEVLLFMSTGPINTVIVNLVNPLQRASAVALSVFAIHLLGDVPSPYLIGKLSDLSSLGKAVMIVPAAVVVCAALWFLAAGSHRVTNARSIT